MEEFEFWLDEMEDKAVTTVQKPATRAEACELLKTAKVRLPNRKRARFPGLKSSIFPLSLPRTKQKLKKESEERELPEEMYDEEYEDDPRVEEFRDRLAVLKATLAENLEKAETLTACWNKLNSDMTNLSKALT